MPNAHYAIGVPFVCLVSSLVACGQPQMQVVCEQPPVTAGAPARDPLGLWSRGPGVDSGPGAPTRAAVASALAYRLDEAGLLAALRRAGKDRPQEAAELTLPLPDGTIERYRAVETAILAPALQERFPEIHAYDLTQVRRGTKASAVWTSRGLYVLLDTQAGAAAIERVAGDSYRVYYSACAPRDEATRRLVEETAARATAEAAPARPAGVGLAEPRRLEIIIATETGYTEQIVTSHGGDLAAMSDEQKKRFVFPYMVELLGELNLVFGTNLGVTFSYHPAELDWLYTSTVHPWAGSCKVSGAGIASENNSRVHVDSSTFGAGRLPDLATVLIRCDGVLDSDHGYSHWRGLCGPSRGESAVLTGLDIHHPNLRAFIAHELGHLLGASHTFARRHLPTTNGDKHYEPGCGSTLMAYGGIVSDCRAAEAADDFVGAAAGDYFSAYSIAEMQSWIAEKAAAGCGAPAHPGVAARGPAVAARTPAGAVVPANTPFYLSVTLGRDDAEASSIDVSFDQEDDGCLLCDGGTAFGQDTGNNAIVRSRLYRAVAGEGHTRPVPELRDLLAVSDGARSSARAEERLPAGARTLHFVALARAQHWYGATTGEARLTVQAKGREGAAGFRFLESPTVAVGGAALTLRWDDAGTGSSDEYQARRVRFRLCLADCADLANYRALLTDATGQSLFPNSGAADVVMPRPVEDWSAARILIENEGATFFNVTRVDMALRHAT